MKTAKIFGIGLSKTGTSSLCGAMTILGFKSKHYIIEEDFLSVIDDYDFINDMPIQCKYKELDKLYPKSKFILTVRENITDWLNSCEYQWLKPTSNPKFIEYRILQMGSDKFDKTLFQEKYISHKTIAIDYFSNRNNDFLILDIFKDSPWKTLCNFLGRKIPRQPFPHMNKNKTKDKNESKR